MEENSNTQTGFVIRVAGRGNSQEFLTFVVYGENEEACIVKLEKFIYDKFWQAKDGLANVLKNCDRNDFVSIRELNKEELAQGITVVGGLWIPYLHKTPPATT